MINNWNRFKEQTAIAVANLLPKSWAYWAFVRVATFECTENPGEQKCMTAADRWKDPARARQNFMGPAWSVANDEFKERRGQQNADPVHEFDDLHYFWDEVWMERLGPYTTRQKALDACLSYGKWLQDGQPESADSRFLPDVAQSDPRHPLNQGFTNSMNPADWAKAFIRIVRFQGADMPYDEKFVSQWFSAALLRGYDQGNPTPDAIPVPAVAINALDSQSIIENGPTIADALVKRFPEGD